MVGLSPEMTFYPSSFEVSADAAAQTAGTAFTLTVTAKNSAGQTTSNYAGTIALDLSAVSPTTASRALSVVTATASAGVATVTQTYTDAGTIAVTAQDTTYVTGITIEGTSSNITFDPAKFTLVIPSPPPRRTAWYVNEIIPITITALGSDDQVTPNYRGTISFPTVSGMSLPEEYAFTASDGGSHEFTDVSATTAGLYDVSVQDSGSASITGSISALNVVQAIVTIANASGPVEAMVDVPVRITNPSGNLIADHATT